MNQCDLCGTKESKDAVIYTVLPSYTEKKFKVCGICLPAAMEKSDETGTVSPKPTAALQKQMGKVFATS